MSDIMNATQLIDLIRLAVSSNHEKTASMATSPGIIVKLEIIQITDNISNIRIKVTGMDSNDLRDLCERMTVITLYHSYMYFAEYLGESEVLLSRFREL